MLERSSTFQRSKLKFLDLLAVEDQNTRQLGSIWFPVKLERCRWFDFWREAG